MRGYDADQAAARQHDIEQAAAAKEAGRPAPDKTQLYLPITGWGEMTSRWDMHASPPDILVTNASMLGAMLSREVEHGMLEQTRRWLTENAGRLLLPRYRRTPPHPRISWNRRFSFLLKSLIQRLG